jgi:hypothetical protein
VSCENIILAAHWKSLLASVYKREELIGIYYRTQKQAFFCPL